MAGVIRERDTVLDIGSGSGTDALIASRLVGSAGKVLVSRPHTRNARESRDRTSASTFVSSRLAARNTRDMPPPPSSRSMV
jgi:tRNA A58 N-methylase Trm61